MQQHTEEEQDEREEQEQKQEEEEIQHEAQQQEDEWEHYQEQNEQHDEVEPGEKQQRQQVVLEVQEQEIFTNCYRRQFFTGDEDDFYVIELVPRNDSRIIFYQKFKGLGVRTEYEGNILLYKECNKHLTIEDSSDANSVDICLPSFMWFILKDENVHREYGNNIW